MLQNSKTLYSWVSQSWCCWCFESDISLLGGWCGCPMQCRVLSSILSLCPLVMTIFPQLWQPTMSPDIVKYLPGLGAKLPPIGMAYPIEMWGRISSIMVPEKRMQVGNSPLKCTKGFGVKFFFPFKLWEESPGHRILKGLRPGMAWEDRKGSPALTYPCYQTYKE